MAVRQCEHSDDDTGYSKPYTKNDGSSQTIKVCWSRLYFIR